MLHLLQEDTFLYLVRLDLITTDLAIATVPVTIAIIEDTDNLVENIEETEAIVDLIVVDLIVVDLIVIVKDTEEQ